MKTIEGFRKLHGVVIPCLRTYLLEMKAKYPSCKIHVGTDSVYKSGKITYFEVVVIRYFEFGGTAGGSFTYRRTSRPGFKQPDGKPDIFTKLSNEYRLSIELANEISQFLKVDVIEFDYNNLVEYESNKYINAAKGWALGEGYPVLYKRGFDPKNPNILKPEIFESPEPITKETYVPKYLAATRTADHLCQKINSKRKKKGEKN